ncbi:four helix bundle protein [bacterium]|nr:four helix bundle protein [bacterium]
MERTARFPRLLRHSLTDRIENLTLGILEDVTSAAFRSSKIAQLRSADDRLNRLRVMVRLCHEMRLLSHGQYEEAAIRLDAAGRLLGAWIRQQTGSPAGRSRAARGTVNDG